MTGSLSLASDITSLDEYNARAPPTYNKPFSAWPKARFAMARSVEKLTRFLCERTAELTHAVHD